LRYGKFQDLFGNLAGEVDIVVRLLGLITRSRRFKSCPRYQINQGLEKILKPFDFYFQCYTQVTFRKTREGEVTGLCRVLLGRGNPIFAIALARDCYPPVSSAGGFFFGFVAASGVNAFYDPDILAGSG
jgi:hypothetical protein